MRRKVTLHSHYGNLLDVVVYEVDGGIPGRTIKRINRNGAGDYYKPEDNGYTIRVEMDWEKDEPREFAPLCHD